MTGANLVDRFPPVIRIVGRRPRVAGAVAVVLGVAVIAAVLLAGAIQQASRWSVRDAVWSPGHADGMPYRHPATVAAQPLGQWSVSAPDRVQIQYAFERQPGAPSDLTLLLPGVNGQAALFINGVPTGPEVSAPETYLTFRGARTSAWTIPAHFLRPGLNRLDLIVTGSRNRPLDAPPVLGPSKSVSPVGPALSRVSRTLRGALPILALIAAALGLGAAAVRKSPSPWVALSAAAAAVGARTLATDATIGPFLGPFGPVLDQAALSAGLICLACAVPAAGARPIRGGTRWGSGAAVALFIVLLALALVGARQGTPALEAAGLTLPVFALLFLAVAGRRALQLPPNPSVQTRLLEGAGLGLLALTSTIAVLGGAGLLWGPWAPVLDTVYGLGVFALLAGTACVAGLRTGEGLWRWARDRPRLSRIILSQQQEIEAAALSLRQQERRSAVLEERQRLSRDMHDGIGGQLSSLLARVRSRGISPEQLEGELTSGLAELRLMVDSLDASDGPVADALAVLRSRVRTQTEAAGMKLEWSQSRDLDGVVADPGWILNLNRLIQESVTNALRHSGGAHLGVEVRMTGDGRLTVTVRDDGVGFDRDQVRPGRGLSNLTFRAAQMGGTIRVRRGEGGRGAMVEAVVTLPGPPAPGGGQSADEMMPS